jgi:hypothetical protein
MIMIGFYATCFLFVVEGTMLDEDEHVAPVPSRVALSA